MTSPSDHGLPRQTWPGTIQFNQLLQVSVDVQSSLALSGRIFELNDLCSGRPSISIRTRLLFPNKREDWISL